MRKSHQIDLPNYQLIVFDIDGTISGQDHIIHPFTRETLLRLREASFPFTLATGKSLPGTIAQANLLEVDLPLVLINGAMLQTREGEVLDAVTLPEVVVRKVIDLCEQEGRDLVMYDGDAIYFKEMTDNMRPVYGHLTTGMQPVGAWNSIAERMGNINKCLVVDTTERAHLFQMGEMFEEAFRGAVDVLHTSAVLVEVMPKGINKLIGLKKLTERMGIPMSQVMAFGDFDNDVEMLSAAGLGIAVANASSRAKKAADLVVGGVDEQGPARFLADLLDRLPE
jgi:5-amino-6-(5-phospho-D-ribitylamino)uracil phosphatase